MTLDGAENLESDRRARTARSEMARQFVGPDGCRVSYLTVRHPAAGPTILLIHGSGVSAGYWVDQLLGLGRALRVVAIDLPGHGASDPIEGASVERYAEATAHFLELLGAGPVIVAGHSLGGAVAIALAARHMDLTDQAPRLGVPTLLLCGSRDRLTPPALSEQLSVLIPRARLRTIEGAGHMLLLEVPERVNQEILTFARSILSPIEVPS